MIGNAGATIKRLTECVCIDFYFSLFQFALQSTKTFCIKILKAGLKSKSIQIPNIRLNSYIIIIRHLFQIYRVETRNQCFRVWLQKRVAGGGVGGGGGGGYPR
jgi:hypothetical protein